MATNTSNRSLTNWLVVPVSRCIPWFAVLVTESLAIITLNIITIAVFVKQRQRQRQSTYLIIHLAVVDLMIGAVNGTVRVYEIGNFCDLWGHDLRDANWLPGLNMYQCILSIWSPFLISLSFHQNECTQHFVLSIIVLLRNGFML